MAGNCRVSPTAASRQGRRRDYQSAREKARQYLDQFLIHERLLQNGPVAVAIPYFVTAVARRKDERYASRAECFGQGLAVAAIQIYIQHGDIEI